MKKLIACVALVAATGCALFTAQNFNRAEEGSRIACIIANALLPDEKAVAQACQLGPEFLDLIKTVVGEHKAALKAQLKAQASLTCSDGGK